MDKTNTVLDDFLTRTYDPERYHCAHFAADVWHALTGYDIRTNLTGLLCPANKATVSRDLRKRFRGLGKPEDPCLILFRHPKLPSHIGVYTQKRVLHLGESGVEFLPLNVAGREFRSWRAYRPEL